MIRLVMIAATCAVIHGCTGKDELPAPVSDGFPNSPVSLPARLAGKWIRTSSLRTFDFKPDEWVTESVDSSGKKYLQLNSDKSYSSNQVNCSECRIEFLNDTLYVRHTEGYYKFPVLQLNDSTLHLKTNIGQPAYSLPNTGLFDFILEEKYSKLR